MAAMPHHRSRTTPRLCATWAAAFALLGTGCGTAPEVQPTQAPLHELLQQLADRHRICHAAVAVVRRHELQTVETAQGCGDGTLTQPDTIFQAASLGKPVFAYAVLQLVQQGRMDLDAPVLSYLPGGYVHRQQAHLETSAEDTVNDPRLRAVTARMALNHTSGLPNWAQGPLHFDAEPGARWGYSGEGYTLLQRAVEAVTGEPLNAFMQRQVFGPLGMVHSAYSRPALPLRTPLAAATLTTTAADYGRFLAALLRDGRTLEQLLASPVPVQPDLALSWGLGWGLERSAEDALLWHWGNNPGYRAFTMASHRTGDAVVLFTDSSRGLLLAEPVAGFVFPGQHPVYRFPALNLGWLCAGLGLC